jgi:ELWxxDGT repeat protein
MRIRDIACAALFAYGATARFGSAQTPYMVKDLNPFGTEGSNPLMGAAVGERFYFSIGPGGAARPDLWTTLGAEASTSFVFQAPNATSTTSPLVAIGPDLYFTLVGLSRLWKTNGTPEGTTHVALAGGNEAAANGGRGVFIGADGVPPLRPFLIDGATALVAPLTPPAGHAHGEAPEGRRPLVPYLDGFAMAMKKAPSERGHVWLYRPGTGTTGLAVCPGVTIGGLFVSGERLFVDCGTRLLVTDGSAAGTRTLLEVDGTICSPLVELDGFVYFAVARDSGTDIELWRTDGTAAGTESFAAIATGSNVFGPMPVVPLVVANGRLFFPAFRPETGIEPWRTDGTTTGTFLLRDVRPGAASSWIAPAGPPAWIGIPGGLLFQAVTDETGSELWKSDGSASGTLPLDEIAPGPQGALDPFATRFVRAGSRVYFGASDVTHGQELWALPLPAGTVEVGDVSVEEGDSGTMPVEFAVRLWSPAPGPVVVSYATVAGTAQAGSDFVPAAGTLTFQPGETEHTVAVQAIGDLADERNESFTLALTAVTGADIGKGRGVAVLIDDEQPRITVAGTSVVEGTGASTTAVFQVTLTTPDGRPSAAAVTVRGEGVPGTASADDLTLVPSFPQQYPTVTFPAGTASGTSLPLSVLVVGDSLDEPNETFHLRLDAGYDAAVPAPEETTGVIVDDDGIAALPPVELTHGARLVADLAPPAGRASDVDYYVWEAQPWASYEVLVDGVSGDAAPLSVERVSPMGTVLQSGQPVGTGSAVSLRWANGYPGGHLRVHSAACGTACGPDDTYRLRFYETTLRGSRVNNVGSSATAVILHNTSGRLVAGYITYWYANGTTDHATGFNIPPGGTFVYDTSSFVPQVAGSITVVHDAPYAALAGKVVAIDPAAGFAFDTPLAPKPR